MVVNRKQVDAAGEDEPEEQRDNKVTAHAHTRTHTHTTGEKLNFWGFFSYCLQVTHSQVSCWSKYLDTPEEAGSEKAEEDNVLMKSQQLHGNNMIDRCDFNS